jgi:hypothetical protein
MDATPPERFAGGHTHVVDGDDDGFQSRGLGEFVAMACFNSR